ncbi:hypothetical protein HDU76_004832 [Blyttiomyces sp. JEL0837]|nr:hypothetical protein HDU76_004832 [Blyttiomyces sp. JEL0837]
MEETLEGVKNLEKSLDDFLSAHTEQLESIGLPHRLWPVLWARIESKRYGTLEDSPFTVVVPDGSDTPVIVTAKDLTPPQSCIVYPHSWTFRSKDEAKGHLDGSHDLRRIVSRLLESLDVMEGKPRSGGPPGDDSMDTKTILDNLYRIAFQYQVTNPTNSTGTDIYYYLSTDPFSPSILPFSGPKTPPVFISRIFLDTRNPDAPEVFTVLFPNWPNPASHSSGYQNQEDFDDDHTILKGTVVTRSEMTAMPDFAAGGYWSRHYDTGLLRQYEWFLGWKRVGGAVKNAIGMNKYPGGAVVLNIGCGNSMVGYEMVQDGTAGLVLSFDIARGAVEAVDTLTRSESEKEAVKGKLKGAEELLVMDGTSSCIRDTSNSLVDFAFDKGTLDGMLYHPEAVELVRKVWDAVAKVTDTFVLVSLGRPENRVILIEDEIRGWEVDQCMEVELGKEGAVGMGVGAGSKIDRCWIYVCKRK